jgi:hypothetical protein
MNNLNDIRALIELLMIGKVPEEPNPQGVNRDAKSFLNTEAMGQTALRNQLQQMDQTSADRYLEDWKRSLANANYVPR